MNEENIKEESVKDALYNIQFFLRTIMFIFIFLTGVLLGQSREVPMDKLVNAIMFCGGIIIALCFTYDKVKGCEKE